MFCLQLFPQNNCATDISLTNRANETSFKISQTPSTIPDMKLLPVKDAYSWQKQQRQQSNFDLLFKSGEPQLLNLWRDQFAARIISRIQGHHFLIEGIKQIAILELHH